MARRTFIAADIPGPIRKRLAALSRQLVPGWPKGQVRWSTAENIHLTLRFLGETAENLVPEVADRLRRVCTTTTPMRLTLSEVGAFPHVRQPRVIWVGIHGDLAPLKTLQGRLEAVAIELGWEPEDRGFRPHLTLGRPRQDARPRTPDWARIETTPTDFTVDSVSLIESQLAPQGATYRTLHREHLA